MKRIFYIVISVVVFDLVFDGEEFLKLPSLFSHYIEHKKVESIDFIDFIVLHYFNSHHGQSSDHQSLPFKDHHNCTHIHIYSHEFCKVQAPSIFFTVKKYPLSFFSNYKLGNYFMVWHPPKWE